MSNLRQAAQMALNALEYTLNHRHPRYEDQLGAMRALREAFDERGHELDQKPVAWQWLDTANYRKNLPADAIPEHWRPLYTTVIERKPLTDEEIGRIAGETLDPWSCARAIERAHGIGGKHE